VTFTYTRNVENAGDITVNYVDTEGAVIHDPQTVSGKIGEAYDVSTEEYKLEIDGYTLDEGQLPTNMTGTFSTQPQNVTFTYTRNV
ncbi:MucBP domain-containing protein, partial [Enterococcus raffinosus]|uniref:MucBP domain-containing protein n=1 Tax=Enterococcus raffinosus TaxID=71452 RepID=UPI003ACDEA96